MSEHLLPRENATSLEVACDLQEQRLLDIAVPIREAFRPYETPAAVLPFLAWERSVDLWDEDWPEEVKRAITARSYLLHKRKGTAWAIREYVRYAGGEVLEIIRPPQKIFSGPSPTREQREAWLSRLPQVRSWLIQDRAPAPAKKAFYGGQRHAHFVETSFSVPSTALERMRRRVRWVVDGQETETRVSEFGSYFRLHIKATAGARVFSNTVLQPARFFVPSDAHKRLVTIQPTPTQPWRSPVGPSMQAVTSEPERVVVQGEAGRGVYSGGIMRDGKFFVPSTAPLRIFDRYAVNDGSRPSRSPAVQFMGRGRYGWPAHTAHVHVSVPGVRHRLAAGEGIVEPRTRFWIPSTAPARVDRVRRAIAAAKRCSDDIKMIIGPRPKFIAGRVFRAGDTFIVGRPN